MEFQTTRSPYGEDHPSRVRKKDRRKGHGRRWIEGFLKTRPPHIHYVQVTPGEEGGGDPTPFWLKMGFRWMYVVGPHDDNPYEMIIGVNGHATPDPRPLRSSNDDEED